MPDLLLLTCVLVFMISRKLTDSDPKYLIYQLDALKYITYSFIVLCFGPLYCEQNLCTVELHFIIIKLFRMYKQQTIVLYLSFESFGCILTSAVTVSCDSSIFRFWRKRHTDFHSGQSNLHSQQKGIWIPNQIFFCFCFPNDNHSDLCEINSQCDFDGISVRDQEVKQFLFIFWPSVLNLFSTVCTFH